jgi:hypothetical protein
MRLKLLARARTARGIPLWTRYTAPPDTLLVMAEFVNI